ncbi:L-erythro-3,5-diaminohexanoate dehydrogenase [Prosthecomicrobium sp. N25]|uniref:L-erythro-3,5-diaminohexanoate dehydrogenase n=1 Tax=Prosthecomicrobium sp. N25 TaxID=3129254 RepID=UPI003077B4DE
MPQPAARVDATPEIWDNEILIDVELLNLDSSSMRQLAEEAGGDPDGVAERIRDIVRKRGKMHNPITNSGGVLVGRILEIGSNHPARHLKVGQLVCPSISLSLIPLVVDEVLSVNVATAQVAVRGTAILFETANIGVIPDDFDIRLALSIIDVCGAPASVQRWVKAGQSVAVLGAGKAGLMAAVAARQASGPGSCIVAFDVSLPHLDAMRSLGVVDEVVQVDLKEAVPVFELARRLTKGKLFDFVINVTNVSGTETAAILCTKDRGSLLFFSMATNFQVAALSAEGAGKDIDMVIGNGFVHGCIDFGFELVREHPLLRAVLAEKL